jgi:hypothetical protein
VNWRGVALSAGSLAVAGLVWWQTPGLLALAGLGDLGVVGRLCLTVLALSVLENVLRRLPGQPHEG